jgi:hypothetical protein
MKGVFPLRGLLKYGRNRSFFERRSEFMPLR